jgi:hypothetical protein
MKVIARMYRTATPSVVVYTNCLPSWPSELTRSRSKAPKAVNSKPDMSSPMLVTYAISTQERRGRGSAYKCEPAEIVVNGGRRLHYLP